MITKTILAAILTALIFVLILLVVGVLIPAAVETWWELFDKLKQRKRDRLEKEKAMRRSEWD